MRDAEQFRIECTVVAAERRCPADGHLFTVSVHHGRVSYGTGRATSADPSNVETRDDLARFLSAVLADFRSTGAAEWENGTLERFLDGLSAFTDARVSESPDIGQERASWRLFAEIVRAATGYE
jgi:hypothetical protein